MMIPPLVNTCNIPWFTRFGAEVVPFFASTHFPPDMALWWWHVMAFQVARCTGEEACAICWRPRVEGTGEWLEISKVWFNQSAFVCDWKIELTPKPLNHSDFPSNTCLLDTLHCCLIRWYPPRSFVWLLIGSLSHLECHGSDGTGDFRRRHLVRRAAEMSQRFLFWPMGSGQYQLWRLNVRYIAVHKPYACFKFQAGSWRLLSIERRSRWTAGLSRIALQDLVQWYGMVCYGRACMSSCASTGLICGIKTTFMNHIFSGRQCSHSCMMQNDPCL